MKKDDPLEKVLEAKCCKYMRNKHGLLTIKMNLLGTRGIPDRMMLGLDRVIFFIEFKRLGKTPTALQLAFHLILRKMGFSVYVIDQFNPRNKKHTEQVDSICKKEKAWRSLDT